MTRNVRITVSFPIAEREEPNVEYNPDAEDLIRFWETVKGVRPGDDAYPVLVEWIQGLLESEPGGIAEYKTVNVEKVEWF